MSDWTPEVRGRFARAVMLAMHHGLAADWNIIIHHIDALEARVALLEAEREDWRADALVLAAECRAWRDWQPEGDMGPLAEPREVWVARAATDAAGALEGGSRG